MISKERNSNKYINEAEIFFEKRLQRKTKWTLFCHASVSQPISFHHSLKAIKKNIGKGETINIFHLRKMVDKLSKKSLE